MATQGSDLQPLFVRCHMENNNVVGMWCKSKDEEYTFDAELFPKMMESGGLKNIFHLKSSPLKVIRKP